MSTQTKPVLTNLDLSGNEIINAKIYPVPSDPESPADGVVWYNTISHQLKFRKNGSTVVVADLSIIITDASLAGASDNNFPSTQAIKTYIDDLIAGMK